MNVYNSNKCNYNEQLCRETAIKSKICWQKFCGCCVGANTKVIKLYIYWLYFHERNTFLYDILYWLTYLYAMKFPYKLSLTGGLILCFGLVWLLLICFRSDFNVCASQLFILSLSCCGWYGFRWFCIFL